MRKTSAPVLAILVAVMGLCTVSSSAFAIPFLFTYRTTIEVSTIDGINAGDEVILEVLADNGGTSPISSVWNEADLISATLTAGTYTASYGAPLTADLDPTFRTDAAGVLDRAVLLGGVIGLNSDSFGVGGNTYLFDDYFLDFFGNPAILSDRLSSARLDLWSGPTAVSTSVPEPEPVTLMLLALGVLAYAAVRGRRVDIEIRCVRAA